MLVRHSKAAHDAPTDIERPLTSKGRIMADALARSLDSRMNGVDLLLVSPAARARQTARPLQERLHLGEIRVEPEIYHHTLDLLGMPAQSCVFVDDIKVNVDAAAQLGIIGVHHIDYGTTATELSVLFGHDLTR